MSFVLQVWTNVWKHEMRLIKSNPMCASMYHLGISIFGQASDEHGKPKMFDASKAQCLKTGSICVYQYLSCRWLFYCPCRFPKLWLWIWGSCFQKKLSIALWKVSNHVDISAFLNFIREYYKTVILIYSKVLGGIKANQYHQFLQRVSNFQLSSHASCWFESVNR